MAELPLLEDDPVDDAGAVAMLRDKFHADSTKSSRGSAIADFTRFCGPPRNLQKFPLEVATLERYAAVRLAEGKAVLAKAYICHLRTENRLNHNELSVADQAYLTFVNKALSRNAAEFREAYEPWGMQLLMTVRMTTVNRHDRLTMDLIVVQFFFCLRPAEVHIVTFEFVTDPVVGDSVRVTVPKCKNDQEAVGRTVHMRASGKLLCPVESARRLHKNRASFNPTKQSHAKSIARLIDQAGIPNHKEGRKRAVYLPHGIRKGGAQSLLLGGTQRDTVQKIAGWKCRMSLLHYEDEALLNPKVQPIQCLLVSVVLMEDFQGGGDSDDKNE